METLPTLPALRTVWCETGTGCRRADVGKWCARQRPVQEAVVRRSGPKKERTGASWMPGVREALAAKPDDLGLIPRAHVVEGEA